VQEGEVPRKRRRRIITKATTVDQDRRSMLRGKVVPKIISVQDF
jgi:hypothetical protein